LIVIYQFAGITRDKLKSSRLSVRFLAWAVMFFLVAGGWMIFRAPSLAWLATILFGSPWANGLEEWVVFFIIISMTLMYCLPMAVKLLLDRRISSETIHAFYYAVLTAGIVIYIGSAATDFIYFQF
ncbi:MAG: hypothetical protein L0287_25605, partial [Anaerolineae bacterium]|nr:hypothetical protein [Anaerolineae bacterium]